MVGYADGGILGYENGGDVEGVYRPRREGESFSDYRRSLFEAELAADRRQAAQEAQAREQEAQAREQERLSRVAQAQQERGGEIIPSSPFFTREPLNLPQPASGVLAALSLPPQDAARAQVLRERQGLGSLGVPTPAPAAAPTAPADLASASPAATARLTAPQPAAAQTPAMPGIQDALSQYRESQRRAADEGAAVVGEEAQAMADIERAALERFEAQQKTAGQGDADTRKRIAEREKKMDQAEKNALLFALARTAIGAYSARTGSTTANLARGLQMGIEGYAADTAKIDETRDALRKEVDRLDALRQQAAEASGKRRDELTDQVKKAQVAAKFAAKKFSAAQGAKISDKEAEVLLDFTVKGAQEQKKQEYRLQEIAAQGAETRRTQAARPAGGAAAATSGTVTAKDMAKLRDDALADWSDSRKGRALQKQFGSFDNYLRTRVANYSGAAPTAPAAPSTKGWSVSPQ